MKVVHFFQFEVEKLRMSSPQKAIDEHGQHLAASANEDSSSNSRTSQQSDHGQSIAGIASIRGRLTRMEEGIIRPVLI